MKTYYINISSIDKVKHFCQEANKVECDIELCWSKYIIDAKSLMGIFSLDIREPLKMIVNADDINIENLKPYIIET